MAFISLMHWHAISTVEHTGYKRMISRSVPTTQGGVKGFMSPTFQNEEFITDAEYVANLVNVSTWL